MNEARRAHRRIEVAALAAHLTLTALLVHRVVGIAGDRVVLLVAILAGVVAADLASGLVHWAADHYGSLKTPLFGKNLVRSFREHHADPEDITRHDFVQTNGDSAIFTLPYLLCAIVFTPAAARFANTFHIALALAVLLTGQIHRWAHMPAPPRVIIWLQRVRVILDREHHLRHHHGAHTTSYCITTGWLNALLDQSGFFRRLEALTERVLGLRPQR
jgi:hypothetical protein